MQSINPASIKYDGTRLSGEIAYRIAGAEHRTSFSYPFKLMDGGLKISSPYPHREIHVNNSDGEIVRYLPVSTLSIAGPIRVENLKRLEVLYVGQAFGDGNRAAFDRLKSHSTLQKILADTHYKYPDDEIQILTFQYAPYRIISSMDGIDRTAIRDRRDDARFPRLLKNPISIKKQICLAEAGLIRYFQPYYNTVYKESFPASDQKVLDECYRLDFSALIVEINTDDFGMLLYSGVAPAKDHHLARFDLIDPAVRRSFFTFVDRDGKACEMPGAFPPSG